MALRRRRASMVSSRASCSASLMPCHRSMAEMSGGHGYIGSISNRFRVWLRKNNGATMSARRRLARMHPRDLRPSQQFLSPLRRARLHCVRPFQRPGVQTCAGGLVRSGPAHRVGAISCTRVPTAAEAKISVTLRGRDATRRMVADSSCAEWGGEGRIQSRTKVKGLTRPAPWFFLSNPRGPCSARPRRRARHHLSRRGGRHRAAMLRMDARRGEETETPRG